MLRYTYDTYFESNLACMSNFAIPRNPTVNTPVINQKKLYRYFLKRCA